jgi:hypothetical protein
MSASDIFNVAYLAIILWFFILFPIAWIRVFNAPLSSRERMAWTFAICAFFPLGTIAALIMLPGPDDQATGSKTKKPVDDVDGLSGSTDR